MKQTVSLCLSIIKSISVWKWNSIGSVSEWLLPCKSWCEHQRLHFEKVINQLLWFSDQPWKKNKHVSIPNKAHLGIFRERFSAKTRIGWNKIYIHDDSASVKRVEQQCQVFRYANVVKEGPLSGSTWPALNHNDMYAAHSLKLSKYFLPCLYLRQIFWCKIFLLSNRVFLPSLCLSVNTGGYKVVEWLPFFQWCSSGFSYGWNVN